MAREDLEAGQWYLQRLEGEDAILEARIQEDSSKLTCPKCLAPMLFIGQDQMICYACGMTFSVEGQRVSRRLAQGDVDRLVSSPAVTIVGDGIPSDAWGEGKGSPGEKRKQRSRSRGH